jgi:hypothetical protein
VPATPILPVAPATAPGSRLGNDQVVVGAPAPLGTPITGDLRGLSPSEQLAGREAALRFRFQQQLQSGELPSAQSVGRR